MLGFLLGLLPAIISAHHHSQSGKKSTNSALAKTVYNLGSYTANILSYAESLQDSSFTVISYKGYSGTGIGINAAPTDSSGIAMIARVSIEYIVVVAIPFDNTGVYSRSKNKDTWSAWVHA